MALSLSLFDYWEVSKPGDLKNHSFSFGFPLTLKRLQEGYPQEKTDPYGCGSKPMAPFWGCTTHFTLFYGVDWDVHWGYDLDFDPWPYRNRSSGR